MMENRTDRLRGSEAEEPPTVGREATPTVGREAALKEKHIALIQKLADLGALLFHHKRNSDCPEPISGINQSFRS